jgi:spermidine/putrescine transport system permease protein
MIKKNYLLITPAIAVFIFLFVFPFIYFFLISLWKIKFYKLIRDYNLINYHKAIYNYVEIFMTTYSVSIPVAIITTIIGFYYSYLARFKTGRYGLIMIFIALITLFGGYLMKIYAWKTILGNEGVINSALIYFHIIKEPLTFLLYTKFGLIITFVHFLLPFAILPTYASLRGVNSIEIDSMKDLGAKFYHVQFMLFFQRCRTGVLASFVFCLLIVSGDFLTPYLIGGKITFIGNMIAPKFGKFFDWPLGSAMSFTMLTTSILIIVIVSYLFKLTNPK